MQPLVFHESFRKLINPSENIEIISDHHKFTEGPLWDDKQQQLLFSDIPANTIYSWSEKQGTSVFLQPSNFANGLAFNKSGDLVICEHQGRVISSLDSQTQRKVLASTFEGLKLNSPNDLVIASDNSVIFTDPIYGLREGNGGPAQQELPFQGVYRYIPTESKLILITDSFERPNGLAFSPDEKRLFIADTVRQHIRVFDINKKWNFTGGDVWAELWDSNYEGRPDGMKFDAQGNLFSTGPGGIWIFSPQADLLGRIVLPDKTSNLAWGSVDHKSLFITSSDKVYRLRCLTAGY